MTSLKRLLSAVLLVLFLCTPIQSHEGKGWTHMKGSAGPCVGTMRCPPFGDHLWIIKYYDGDDKVDRCISNRLIHDVWHVKEYKVDEENNICTCEEKDVETNTE